MQRPVCGDHHCPHEDQTLHALFLQFLEIHGGGNRAQAVDELGFDQFAELSGVVGAAAERLRS